MKQAISAPLRRAASFVVLGPALAGAVGRSTPGFVHGRVYTVAGPHSLADLGHEYDPRHGIPLEEGYRTPSSPPIAEVPAKTRYGTMTYVHEGRQYVVLQTGPTLTAVALPE